MNKISFFLWTGLSLLLVMGCGQRNESTATLPARDLQANDPPEPTAVPAITSSPMCLPVGGSGTIAPDISILDVTFLVNGRETVVAVGDTLSATEGDEVRVTDVSLCVSTYSGNGGEYCVDIAPVGKDGQELMSQHSGSHMSSLRAGFLTLSMPDYTWAVDQDWSGFIAIVNHWPPQKTADPGCAGGSCERDHRLFVAFHR